MTPSKIMTARTSRELARLKRAAIVDGFADQYLQIEQQEKALAKAKRKIRNKLLTLSRRYGAIANQAKTMRIAHGIAFDVRATYPSETVIDQDAAREFERLALHHAGRFFRLEEKLVLVKGAFDRISDLTEKQRARFCLAAKRRSLSPRVKVVKARR